MSEAPTASMSDGVTQRCRRAAADGEPLLLPTLRWAPMGALRQMRGLCRQAIVGVACEKPRLGAGFESRVRHTTSNSMAVSL